MDAKKWIIDNCFTNDGNKLNRWKEKETIEVLKDYEGKSFGEKVYRILHGISCECRCKCGNLLEFRGFQHGYAVYCSRRCAGEYTADKSSETKLNHFSNVEVKDTFIRKMRETKKNRYNNENYNNRDLAKETCIEKYGVENPSQSKYVIERIINTKRECSIFDDGYIQISLEYDTIICLNNIEWLRDSLDVVGVYELSDILGCSVTTIYRRCDKYGILFDHRESSIEKEVFGFLSSIYSGEIIRNTKKVISPLELDIYIPEKNIAIEVNGIYWHSQISGNKNNNYHLEKTKKCEEKGIQLFHIFDNEWSNNKDVWKSVLENSLGIAHKKIGARETKIKSIDFKTTTEFCSKNHLQGKSLSSINLGMFYKDELVAVMTFSKARFSDAEYELQRFCSKVGFVIYGAASKLLKYFRNEYKGRIISYANRRWSTGNLYKKLGFDFIHDSEPNYFYFKNYGCSSKFVLESRNKYQKHKLINILEKYNNKLSEWDNMTLNGYDRIFDSGNKVYMLY